MFGMAGAWGCGGYHDRTAETDSRELSSFHPGMELIPLAGPLIDQRTLDCQLLIEALESIHSISHIGKLRPKETESIQGVSYTPIAAPWPLC